MNIASVTTSNEESTAKPPAKTPWKERWEDGRKRRAVVKRSQHGEWKPATDRKNPLELLEKSNEGRMPQLIPVRYARMLGSPLAFFRGAAIIMAADLAGSPETGIHTQICGDCHATNFGFYASPERNLVFDVNDFDETHLGAWEWDVKRLAASFAITSRQKGVNRAGQRDIVAATLASYRVRITEFSRLSTIDLWYARLDEQHLLEAAHSSEQRTALQKVMDKARTRTVASQMSKLTEKDGETLRIAEHRPLIFHGECNDELTQHVHQLFQGYRKTITHDRRYLFDRFQALDVAYKVVGVGSVGTRCGMALLADHDGLSLFLQVKEAVKSVLEPYFGRCNEAHQGQRVVDGQRLMQAVSDPFLGWTQDAAGRYYYVRQLRDMKMSLDIDAMKPSDLQDYGELCGWAMARAHAKPGYGAEIAGYLGDDDNFDQALAKFAVEYADQNERDFETFQAAAKADQIVADVKVVNV